MENIEEIIKKIANTIRENYVNSEMGEKVAARIIEYIGSPGWKRAIESENIYRLIANINCLIMTITDDAHFNITMRSEVYAPSGDGGIDRYTPHYVRIREFQGLYDEFTRVCWVRVFDQLQDPVVFDIRDCPGGSPELAYFLLCHLFPDGTPLIEFQTRHGDPKIFRSASSFPFYTTYNTIKKYNGELRVLINGFTASAAESFAYVVQHRGRGKLYGSKSSGNAHIQYTTRFGDLFLHLPFARTCDPDTHEDWEGKGLTPDYPVGSPEYIKLIYSEVSNYTMTPVDPKP